MGKTTQQMDINPGTVSTEQMIAILDACPKEMHPHQVTTIARLLGIDIDQELIRLWIEQNCEYNEDHHHHEENYDEDLEHLLGEQQNTPGNPKRQAVAKLRTITPQ